MAFAADTYSLIADIGGTNTRVALAEGPTVLTDTIKRYKNADYPGIETVLRTYLEEQGGVDCIGAAVDLAGPVRDGVGTMTNLDWTIDKETVARAAQAEHVAILNDLQAFGHALGHLPETAVRPLVDGPEGGPNAAKLVVNVGTGFNAAPVYDTAWGRLVTPSECGHANLPIRTEEELRLCQYVSTAHGFPAIEDVLSGRGLERVYAWLGHEAGDPRELAAQDIMAALARGDDRATKAGRVFTRILGTVTGNLALIHLPFGGIYLVGGVVRAFEPYLMQLGFNEAFRDKGRFAGYMGNFRIDVVEDDYAALTGLARHLASVTYD